jgi:hypothetical protein
MYPSFKDKADREAKLAALLKLIERDDEIERVKRARYREMVWASDNADRIARPTIPKEDGFILTGINAGAKTQAPPVKQEDGKLSELINKVDELVRYIEEKDPPAVKRDAAKPDPIEGLDDFQYNARDEVIKTIKETPDILKQGDINPISKNKQEIKKVKFGEDGGLYTTKSNNPSQMKIDNIDWVATGRVVRERKLSLSDLSTEEKVIPEVLKLIKSKPDRDWIHPFDAEGRELTDLRIYSNGNVRTNDGKEVKVNIRKKIDWENTRRSLEGTLRTNVGPVDRLANEFGQVNLGSTSSGSGLIRHTRTKFESSQNSRTSSSSTAHKLIGRGLRGRGGSQMREDVSVLHRNTLPPSIQDALRREYLNRPIGCKYINLKALGEGYLSLKHPAGSSVGRRVKLSPEVLELIREYVFDNRFDVDRYEALTTDDKHIVYDTFKICKLLNTFRKPLSDPSEVSSYMRPQLDKLIGELSVGNRSSRIKDELKLLAIDEYQKGQLNDTELKRILKLTI